MTKPLYGRSKGVGFHGVVYDDENNVVRECDHDHATRSAAEHCGRQMKEEVQREQDQAAGSPG